MSTAAQVAALVSRRLNTLSGNFPSITTDAVALASRAEAVTAAATAVRTATQMVATAWSALPTALEAPGAVEPLYTAMQTPERMAGHLAASCAAVTSALSTFAAAVTSARRTFDDLWSEGTRLRADADARQATQTAAAVAEQRRRQGSPLESPPSTSSLLVHEVVLPDAPDLSHRLVRFEGALAAANETWTRARAAAAEDLRAARRDLDPDLLIGPTTATTAGLTPARPPSTVDGLALGVDWYLGREHANRVFAADSDFAHRLRDSATVADARQAVLRALQDGSAQQGLPLQTVRSRTLTRLTDIPSGAVDIATILTTIEARGAQLTGGPRIDAAADGHVPGDIDVAFLGSFGLTAVPVRISAGGRAVVRYTVTNTTTAASGTRLPVDGLNPLSGPLDEAKNLLGQRNGHPESTQTITWTETVRFEPAAGSGR